MILKDLQEKRERLVVEARERLDQITANTEEGRASELETQHDAAMAELDKLDANITRAQRLETEERKQEEARETALRNRRPNFTATTETAVTRNESEDYRAAFHAMVRAGGNVASMDPEMRTQLTSLGNNGDGSLGGYTVPTTVGSKITETVVTFGPLYDDNIVFTLQTEGGAPIQMPTVDDTNHMATFHVEGQPLGVAPDVVFAKKVLQAYAYDTGFLGISKELLDDSVLAMETFIAKMLGLRLARKVNAVLTNGSGNNEPLGINTGASVGVTAAAHDAVTADELISLFYSVDPAYRASPKAAWLFNDASNGAVRKIKESGTGRYVWTMGDITKGEPDTILGKPVYVNQNSPAMAAGNRAVLFGDLSQFIVRKAGGPLVGAISDSKFWPGVGVGGFIRVDSTLLVPSAIKALVMAA